MEFYQHFETYKKACGDTVTCHESTCEVNENTKQSITSMSSMLQLGRQRRQRWRARHEEFIGILTDHKDQGIAPCGSRVVSICDQFDLQPCTLCGRQFNPITYEKHLPRCREAQLPGSGMSSMSPETIDALNRFKKRMKYKPVISHLKLPCAGKTTTFSSTAERLSIASVGTLADQPSQTGTFSQLYSVPLLGAATDAVRGEHYHVNTGSPEFCDTSSGLDWSLNRLGERHLDTSTSSAEWQAAGVQLSNCNKGRLRDEVKAQKQIINEWESM